MYRRRWLSNLRLDCVGNCSHDRMAIVEKALEYAIEALMFGMLGIVSYELNALRTAINQLMRSQHTQGERLARIEGHLKGIV